MKHLLLGSASLLTCLAIALPSTAVGVPGDVTAPGPGAVSEKTRAEKATKATRSSDLLVGNGRANRISGWVG